MKNMSVLCLVILVMAGSAFAVDHGSIGISGEVRANTADDYDIDHMLSDPRYYEPNTIIGFRYYTNKYVGIGIRLGYMSRSEVKLDTATMTNRGRPEKSFVIEGELLYRLAESERSYLGIVGRLGMTTNRMEIQIWDPGSAQPGYHDYNSTILNLFLGLEPTYFFNKHFAMYSTFGLKIRSIPESKYIVYPAYYTHDDFVNGNYEIKDHKDSRTWFGFDGIWIGMRYCP